MNKNVKRFMKMLRGLSIEPLEKSSIIENFSSLIQSQSRQTPEKYFDRVDNGAYKDVYWLDSQYRYVIKFIVESNNTQLEICTLRNAQKQDLDNIFIPTRVMKLTSNYLIRPSMQFKSDSSEISNISHVMIQDAIGETCYEADGFDYDRINSSSLEAYKKFPLQIDGSIIEYSGVKKCPIDHANWLIAVVQNYGQDYLTRLNKFIHDNQICDLHIGNIGYTYDGRPVIIDFC